MSSITSSINLGAITQTFTPTIASCTSTCLVQNPGSNWLALNQNEDPSCMPPQFNRTPEYIYSPGICPSGYNYACMVLPSTSNGVVGTTVATCCPGSSFTCAPGRQSGALEEIYACYATVTANSTTRIASTSYGDVVKVGTIDTTVASGDMVWAYGIAIARGSTDAAWTTASSVPTSLSATLPQALPVTTPGPTALSTASQSTPTGTANAQQNTGLTGGAKAGIGIGAALGGLLLVLLGFFIARRRHRKTASHPNSAATAPFVANETHPDYQVTKHELDSEQVPAAQLGGESLNAWQGKPSLPVYHEM